MTICSKCRKEHDRDGRYCSDCHAAYMREWRKDHRLEGEARKRSNARTYAKVYLKRGKIVALPCQKCGAPKSEMHHPDHELPNDVIWLCRPCHLAWHAHFRELARETFFAWLNVGKRAANKDAA